MDINFSIAYSKYCLALDADNITDEIRDDFCGYFEEPDLQFIRGFVGRIINTIIKHYLDKDQLDFAKEECLKLDFDTYLPNKEVFSRVLDFLMISRIEPLDKQINAINDVLLFVKNRDEHLDYFNKGILSICLSRIVASVDPNLFPAVTTDPDLTTEVLNSIEKFSDVDYYIELIDWYW